MEAILITPLFYIMYLSNNDALMLVAIAEGWLSPNLNTLSTTDNSVLVVSNPQNALQSLTTMPAPMTELPLLTVPAYEHVKEKRKKSRRKNS